MNLDTAWQRAKRRIQGAAELDVDAELREVPEPVARARRLAELAAPMDMRLTLALGLGCSVAELEHERHGVRVMGDLAFRRLAIVGLKSGESIEHDVSDRLKDALSRFFEDDATDAARPSATEDG